MRDIDIYIDNFVHPTWDGDSKIFQVTTRINQERTPGDDFSRRASPIEPVIADPLSMFWLDFFVLCSTCFILFYIDVFMQASWERRWIIHSLVILDLLIFMMNDVSFGVDSTPKYGETNWHKFMWHKHDHHDHLIQVYFNLFPIIKSDRTVLPAWYRWCIPDIFQVSR